MRLEEQVLIYNGKDKVMCQTKLIDASSNEVVQPNPFPYTYKLDPDRYYALNFYVPQVAMDSVHGI